MHTKVLTLEIVTEAEVDEAADEEWKSVVNWYGKHGKGFSDESVIELGKLFKIGFRAGVIFCEDTSRRFTEDFLEKSRTLEETAGSA